MSHGIALVGQTFMSCCMTDQWTFLSTVAYFCATSSLHNQLRMKLAGPCKVP